MLKINSVWTVHWIQPDIMQDWMDKTFPGLEIHVFEDSSSNPGSGDLQAQKFVWQQLYVRQFIKLEYI